MSRRGPARLLVVACALAAVGGCDPDDPRPPTEPASPSAAPFPADLTAYVDQGRLQRIGRQVFVRLIHDDTVDGGAERTVTVTRADITSDRFGPVTWTGEKTFMNEADLEFDLPPGACGTGADADVRLTYRLDDGPELVSDTVATDRYGAIALFLDRDCAQRTVEEAADVTLGTPRVVGTGASSVFELDVTFTPTGARDDVAFAGFGSTVLFRTLAGTPEFPGTTPAVLDGDRPVAVTLRLGPSRCDPHALAEDKVGTLVYLHVVAPELPAGAYYFVPIDDATRKTLRGYFADACGFND